MYWLTSIQQTVAIPFLHFRCVQSVFLPNIMPRYSKGPGLSQPTIDVREGGYGMDMAFLENGLGTYSVADVHCYWSSAHKVYIRIFIVHVIRHCYRMQFNNHTLCDTHP
ncbi:hypothetical protein TNCT_475641 [Trichonephila clavata]|uniref:Uncharacterized protein n=1 Tax=Trichonephila clavata TaxID=2740835 RepID=A0A8X6G8E1_TRICU|nr:hypothetical protein TNCT_475641 [Trichonephila clavata]